MILGIDEVGRGPWAGPLVIGAVVLGPNPIEGLTDSKKLSKKRREALDVIIREQAVGFGLGWVSAAEIDEIGLSAALRLATVRAVEQVKVPYHEIIIDGTINFLKETSRGQYVTTLAKADLLVPSVSAASIIAKVARDAFMSAQDELYPGYGFRSHVGYGTAAHVAAIEKLGVTPLHRLSFAPLQKYRVSSSSAPSSGSFSSVSLITKEADSAAKGGRGLLPTTKQIGDRAETEVVNYLVGEGHEIIERNWKTKYCEIDIVSRKKGVIYFTEVKYRKNNQQGGGLAAITTKKLHQMKFAAQYYALKNNQHMADLRLAVAGVVGPRFALEQWTTLD